MGNDVTVVDSSSNLRLLGVFSVLSVIVAVAIDSVIDVTSSDSVVICLKSFVLDIRFNSMSMVSVALDVLSNIVFVISFVLVLLVFSAPEITCYPEIDYFKIQINNLIRDLLTVLFSCGD